MNIVQEKVFARLDVVIRYLLLSVCGFIALYFLLILSPLLFKGTLPLLVAILGFMVVKARNRLASFSSGTLFMIPFTASFIWVLAIGSEPVSDFLQFHAEAINFFSGSFGFTWAQSKNPLSSLYFALFYRLLGNVPLVGAFAAAILWGLQTLLIRSIAMQVGINKESATFVAAIYAICPGVIFFGGVISSESVFITLMLSATSVGIAFLNRPSPLTGLLFGLLFGLTFLTRANGAIFLFPLLALTVIYGVKHGGAHKKLLPIAISITMVLGFQLYINSHYEGRLSVSPTKWGTYNLLAGTNMEYLGAWNPKDLELAGYSTASNAAEFREADKRALSIALQRITESPYNFLKFAFGVKLHRLWGGDSESIFWSTTKSNIEDPAKLQPLHRLADAFMYLIITASLMGLLRLIKSIWSKARVIDTDLLVQGALILSLSLNAFLHLFVEVQGRYHLPFYPYMLIIFGLYLTNSRFMKN